MKYLHRQNEHQLKKDMLHKIVEYPVAAVWKKWRFSG